MEIIMATVKTLTCDVEQLQQLVKELSARVAELEAAPRMKVARQVAPRPPVDDTGIVARSAAISRLHERFPDRRSFTSIEVMDELASHA
jgi:hypothetical protein